MSLCCWWTAPAISHPSAMRTWCSMAATPQWRTSSALSMCSAREARTTATECGVRYLSVCSGIEAVSVAWATARLAARHVRRDRSLLLLAAALALSRIAAHVHAESA